MNEMLVAKTESEESRITIKKLMKTALLPVGSTMYIWGGGWNPEDTGAGIRTRTLGLCDEWKTFFDEQRKDYDYKKIKGQREKGLDCAGYIGWVLYNTFHRENGKNGYVMKSTDMAKNFALKGWGVYTGHKEVKDYLAGDIMSMPGHVWLVIGACEDGSVVLLHASPPGVQISGTWDRRGRENSRADALARFYMKTMYPIWYEKYGHTIKSKNYLPKSNQMSWDLSGNAVMADPDGYRQMTAAEILNDLFCGHF